MSDLNPYEEGLALELQAAQKRIEALTEQLAAARKDAEEAEVYAEELEAKLEKAVDALERIAGVKGPYNHPFPETYEGYGAFAIVTSRETIAEVKGADHE